MVFVLIIGWGFLGGGRSTPRCIGRLDCCIALRPYVRLAITFGALLIRFHASALCNLPSKPLKAEKINQRGSHFHSINPYPMLRCHSCNTAMGRRHGAYVPPNTLAQGFADDVCNGDIALPP